jgi:hypothetical protein
LKGFAFAYIYSGDTQSISVGVLFAGQYLAHNYSAESAFNGFNFFNTFYFKAGIGKDFGHSLRAEVYL